MFVNRGMVEAARSEGEVVGVMAHELSHVLLRHGTANATKAQNAQFGALAGAIAGAVIGGRVGSAVQQGSQFGLGTLLLKYSRDYEKQADLLGRRSWPGPATTLSIWGGCSKRSRRKARAAAASSG